MITIAWYLLKVIICSGILCGYYFLALRNKIFHRWNRFYLLASVVISMLVPLMKINILQKTDTQKGTVIQMLQTISYGDEIVVEYSRNSGFHINSENFAGLTYLLISSVFLAIFFIALYKIKTLKKKYPETKIEGISFINTNAKGTPFSFLNFIFWNNAIDLHSKPGQQIFNHEIAHIKEKHTYDKIFMNVVLIFFWINPFFWLMRKELNMIHEFIADQEALEGSDLNAFAEMILQTVYPGQNFSITNNFFYSPLKRRIIMLTKNKNPKAGYLGRLLVLPLAAIVIFAFTLKVKTAKSDKMVYTAEAINSTLQSDLNVSLIKKTDSIPNMYYKNKKVNSLESDQSKVKITYDDGSKETITKAEAKKRGFNFPPPPVPPIAPVPPADANPAVPPLPPPPPPPPPPLPPKALYVVNGKIVSVATASAINPNDIESVNVIKGEKALTKYGEKGKNGVIEITEKNYNVKDVVIINGPSTIPPGLIFLNEKEISQTELKKYSPDDFESVSVLKGESAVKKYGDRAKDGVVEITTKPKEQIQKDTLPARIFTKVENEATFPGGPQAWQQFIIKAIRDSASKFTKADYGTCVVRFIVNTDGKVSNVEATTMKDTRLAETAVNAIRTGPNWIAATQNGHTVAAYRLQPVTLTEVGKK